MVTTRRDRDMAYIMEAQNALHDLLKFGALEAWEKAEIKGAVKSLYTVEQAWNDAAFNAGKEE